MARQNKDGTYNVRLTQEEYRLLSRVIGHHLIGDGRHMRHSTSRLYDKFDHEFANKAGPLKKFDHSWYEQPCIDVNTSW